MRSVRTIGALLVGLSGCGQFSDPSVPCSALAQTEARAGTVAASSDAAVIAMSDAPRPWIVHWRCPDGASRSAGPNLAAGCTYQRTYLESEPPQQRDDSPERGSTVRDDIKALSGGSALLVSSTGHYVVAVDQAELELRTWRIDPWAADPVRELYARNLGPDEPTQLVASMRGTDVVLTRDRDRALRWMDAATGIAKPLAPEHPLLKLVAIGEQFVVGREVVDGERDRLVLVGVGAEHEFELPVELMVAAELTRVELVAHDEVVVVSADGGDGPETFVFSVPDGELVDRFVGAAVNGNVPLESLPGLRASTPDGSRVVYRTPTGALAMRELQAASSCLVRSASAGDHNVAGFSADGMLYMQADGAFAESHLLAFDPSTRRVTALDAGTAGHHLVAAPPSLAEGAAPWAVGVREGGYTALHGSGSAMALGLDAPVFVPRLEDGHALWLGDTYQDDDDRTRFGLRRIEADGSGFMPMDDTVPTIMGEHGPVGPNLTSLSASERPCLATGTPGGWAYQCGNPRQGGFLAAAPAPGSEEPGSDRLDPEVPDPQDPPPAND